MRRAIDVDGGLRAIVPDTQPQAGESESAAERNPHATLGLVADLLGAQTLEYRLGHRLEPALDALAGLFAVAIVRALTAAVLAELGRSTDSRQVLRRARTEVGGLARGGALDRGLDLAFERLGDFAETRDADTIRRMAGDLDRALDRGDARAAGDLARSMAVRLDEIRAQLRDLARERAGHLGDRLRASLERDVDRCPEGNAVLAAAWATALDRARHDFAGADLSGVALGRFTLDGLLWSSATRWPSDTWRGQVRADSAMIGPDLYEIRGRQVHDSNGVRSPAGR